MMSRRRKRCCMGGPMQYGVALTSAAVLNKDQAVHMRCLNCTRPSLSESGGAESLGALTSRGRLSADSLVQPLDRSPERLLHFSDRHQSCPNCFPFAPAASTSSRKHNSRRTQTAKKHACCIVAVAGGGKEVRSALPSIGTVEGLRQQQTVLRTSHHRVQCPRPTPACSSY